MLPNYRRIVIRGEAGAGKSTLLQWLAIMAARQQLTGVLAPWNELVPFFIRLHRHVNCSFPSTSQFCEDFVHTFAVPSDWIEKQLDSGKALVLIDGVDELPRTQRTDLLKKLRALVRDFPNAIYIITSRPGGLKTIEGNTWNEWERWTVEAKFKNLILEPMSIADMDLFVQQWHAALAQEQRREDRNPDLAATAANLQRLLSRRPELRRLATTPLLCGMICLLHRECGESLPQARLQLYSECVQMLLLNRCDEDRKISSDKVPLRLKKEQEFYLLQDFAYWMQRKCLTSAKRAIADQHFGKRLPLMNLPEDVTGQDLTALFLEQVGLLREPELGQVDFAHRLQRLDLDRTTVDDLTPLARLKGLQSLSLNDTKVDDLTPLASLTGLQSLSLNDTTVDDLTPLDSLRGLQHLSLAPARGRGRRSAGERVLIERGQRVVGAARRVQVVQGSWARCRVSGGRCQGAGG